MHAERVSCGAKRESRRVGVNAERSEIAVEREFAAMPLAAAVRLTGLFVSRRCEPDLVARSCPHYPAASPVNPRRGSVARFDRNRMGVANRSSWKRY
jgi:hypothetical protein